MQRSSNKHFVAVMKATDHSSSTTGSNETTSSRTRIAPLSLGTSLPTISNDGMNANVVPVAHSQDVLVDQYDSNQKHVAIVLRDHLSFTTFITRAVWPGLGLLGESYLVFSMGTLPPLWDALFFDNDNENTSSNQNFRNALLHRLSLSVVCGVIVGMLLLGYAADKMGRRRGSILTASLMVCGALGMTLVSVMASSSSRIAVTADEADQPNIPTVSNLFTWLAVAVFVLGLGVGGEYPLSAASAAEKDMQSTSLSASSPASFLDKRHYSNGAVVKTFATTTGSLHGNKDEPLLGHTSCTKRMADGSGANGTVGSTTGICTPSTTMTYSTRGRDVQLVFTMQGMGIFLHCLLLTLLLWMFGRLATTTSNQYESTLLYTWQIVYAVGAVILLTVLITRCLYLQESTAWQESQRQQSSSDTSTKAFSSSSLWFEPTISERSVVHTTTIAATVAAAEKSQSRASNAHAASNPYGLLLQQYGVRLVAVSTSWFLWDVAFYGNKLFQSAFLLSLTSGQSNDNDNEATSLVPFAAAATLNALVALLGYFGAAAILDHSYVGRRRLQQYGFIVTGCLFVSVGLWLDRLPTGLLVTLYFLSSFFGQLGPNATTFILPAEVFPTSLRTWCHGIAAASGKLGALVAALVFGSAHMSQTNHNADRFLYSGYASLIAAVITCAFIPETVGLDLNDNDVHWQQILVSNRARSKLSRENNGNIDRSIQYSRHDWDPKFLSVFEQWQQRQASQSRQAHGNSNEAIFA